MLTMMRWPSSDMLDKFLKCYIKVAKTIKQLGMAAEEPTVSADGLVYTFQNYVTLNGQTVPSATAGDFVYVS